MYSVLRTAKVMEHSTIYGTIAIILKSDRKKKEEKRLLNFVSLIEAQVTEYMYNMIHVHSGCLVLFLLTLLSITSKGLSLFGIAIYVHCIQIESLNTTTFSSVNTFSMSLLL